MKQLLHYLAGNAGLLPTVDAWNSRRALRRLDQANRTFNQAHPEYATPPPALSFDAYNHVDWTYYRESGIDQARFLGETIRRYLPGQRDLEVLEWGCGPGRILRRLPNALSEAALRLYGCDVNDASIAICRRRDGLKRRPYLPAKPACAWQRRSIQPASGKAYSRGPCGPRQDASA